MAELELSGDNKAEYVAHALDQPVLLGIEQMLDAVFAGSSMLLLQNLNLRAVTFSWKRPATGVLEGTVMFTDAKGNCEVQRKITMHGT